MTGLPGKRSITVTAVKAGTASLTVTHARPWETNSLDSLSIEITVV